MTNTHEQVDPDLPDTCQDVSGKSYLLHVHVLLVIAYAIVHYYQFYRANFQEKSC